ncbi:MAG: hypothetical protein HKN41_13635 [Ilumatobacter sp.]|nr:hypothetical protein [Ilumatobacter sp.]
MSARAFRTMMAVLAVAAAIIVGLVVASVGGGDEETEAAPILREYDRHGVEIPFEDQIEVGETELIRTEDALTTTSEMGDLVPNGAYTFWLVVYQGDREFPTDIFVNHGVGVVADAEGRAEAVMRSAVGDASISGFYVEDLGETAQFSPLVDPMNGRVRVEVVYHGQADVAGDDLDAWLADFWTGDPDVCADPLGTLGTGAVPEHPYCAGYWAATFEPDDAQSSPLSRAPSSG